MWKNHIFYLSMSTIFCYSSWTSLCRNWNLTNAMHYSSWVALEWRLVTWAMICSFSNCVNHGRVFWWSWSWWGAWVYIPVIASFFSVCQDSMKLCQWLRMWSLAHCFYLGTLLLRLLIYSRTISCAYSNCIWCGTCCQWSLTTNMVWIRLWSRRNWLTDTIKKITRNSSKDFQKEHADRDTAETGSCNNDICCMTRSNKTYHPLVPLRLTDRAYREPDGAECFSGFGINKTSYENGGSSDTASWNSTSLMIPRTDILDIFLHTHERDIIRLSMNLQDTVFELREKIYNILHIPLNQWRLFSCGGRLFWDSRQLALYDIKNQGTVYIRLLMKGGGSKSKRNRQEHSTLERGSSRIVKPENSKGIIARERRSERLNIKRPRVAQEDSTNSKMQYCPLCNEELANKNDVTSKGLIFCRDCGRGFHLT